MPDPPAKAYPGAVMSVQELPSKPNTLRDRKKAKVRATIIEAAIRQFRDNGFEKTRIEDIAVAAEVAVATMYNYFPTKQQILLEIARKATDDAQPAIQAIVAKPPRNPIDALIAMLKADCGNLDAEDDKKLWRELLATMIRDQESRIRIEAVRDILRGNFRTLISALIQNGQLRKSINVEVLSDICYAIYAYHFRQLVCLEATTTAQALKLMRRDFKMLLE